MRTLIYSLWLVATVLSGTSVAADDLTGLSPQERIKYLRNAMLERKACLRMQKYGNTAGVRLYKEVYRSCTDFLLAGGNFDQLVTPLDSEASLDEQCYQAGLRVGLAEASIRQWLPCSDEYAAAIAKSNSRLIEECQAISDRNTATMGDFTKELKADASQAFDPDTVEKLSKIYFIAELGYGSKVWDDLLELTETPNMSKATCSLILAKGLTGSRL